jgi:hypothetical protein
VCGINHHVEIRYNIPLDVILPGNDSPTVSCLYGRHDSSHIAFGDELTLLAFEEKLVEDVVGGLMRERPLRTEIMYALR